METLIEFKQCHVQGFSHGNLSCQWSFDQRSKANIIGYYPEGIAEITVKVEIMVARAINNPPNGAVGTCPEDSRC